MILIVMGVSGSGKTTVGRLLAERLGWPFYDGDDFHSPANVAKMAQGIPLTDADRATWLGALADQIRRCLEAKQSAVVGCSALKAIYRDRLRVEAEQVKFIYLKGSYELILQRMQARPDHFMQPKMLDSQFATLEEPDDALTIEVGPAPETMVSEIIQALKLQ